MDIKILDSHLREHLETKAKPTDIAKALSLSSASIERVEPFGKGDSVYSVEVTTNRPDMLSVRGLAREAATVLPEFGFDAKLLPIKLSSVKTHSTGSGQEESLEFHVVNDDKLVRRICGVVLEVEKGESPQFVKDRLEAAGIRSLNNLVDITNYVMLEMGHPSHAFDYDRLTNKTLIVRESKKGEKVITLDHKEHTLSGGDIVADNGEGEIIDLLGIMGTANSVVNDNTKRILFFFDNNDPWRIRKTSMGLAIRTDAAALNEKGVDPELAMQALQRGVLLYKEVANAKVMSDIIDIYPGKVKTTTIRLTNEQISTTIGVDVPLKQSVRILKSLGFGVETEKSTLMVKVPSWRELDVTIAEDVIEEVARLYGYHNIPSLLPPFETAAFYHQATNQFYWENKAKQSLKYWGFTEVYTYSMVSETLLEGPLEEAITLSNPLDSEHVHMRRTLTPSLLQVLDENKAQTNIKIFEISNTYHKNKKQKLPQEVRKLAFITKGHQGDFFHAKGLVEQLAKEFGITNLSWEDPKIGGLGASVYIGKEYAGEIEVLTNAIVCVELNFEVLLSHATLKKTYTPLAKYPAITEDISFVLPSTVKTGQVIEEIKQQSNLITDVSVMDVYEDSRTFHIVYQHKEKNLTTEEVADVRKKIIASVEKNLKGKVK